MPEFARIMVSKIEEPQRLSERQEQLLLDQGAQIAELSAQPSKGDEANGGDAKRPPTHPQHTSPMHGAPGARILARPRP